MASPLSLKIPCKPIPSSSFCQDSEWSSMRHMAASGSQYLSICSSICPSICLSVSLSVYLFVCLSGCLFVCLSVCLSICLFALSLLLVTAELWVSILEGVCSTWQQRSLHTDRHSCRSPHLMGPMMNTKNGTCVSVHPLFLLTHAAHEVMRSVYTT